MVLNYLFKILVNLRILFTASLMNGKAPNKDPPANKGLLQYFSAP